MKRCIVTYADGAHEELLDVALPTYRAFAEKHGYDLLVTRGKMPDHLIDDDVGIPSQWNKIPLLLDALERYDEAVWFDCDLVVVDPIQDFPPLNAMEHSHSLVRHYAWQSEVPNTGVWRVNKSVDVLLRQMSQLTVFRDHGWWEQAALMTLMGYTVPTQGSDFRDTKCKNVVQTQWYNACQFMRLCWNSHPNYRADHPRIVHCSYPDMARRLEVMRALVKDPDYDYPRYNVREEKEGDDEESKNN